MGTHQIVFICRCLHEDRPVDDIHIIQDEIVCCDVCYQTFKRLSSAVPGVAVPLKFYGYAVEAGFEIYSRYLERFRKNDEHAASHLHLSLVRERVGGRCHIEQLI